MWLVQMIFGPLGRLFSILVHFLVNTLPQNKINIHDNNFAKPLKSKIKQE